MKSLINEHPDFYALVFRELCVYIVFSLKIENNSLSYILKP